MNRIVSTMLLALISGSQTDASVIPMMSYFCGLAADGSVVGSEVKESSAVAGSIFDCSYSEKDLVAYKYEVCGEYDGKYINLDSGSQVTRFSASPMKLGRVFEVQVPTETLGENGMECSIDRQLTCEDQVGEVILDVQFDLNVNSDGERQSRGLYGNDVEKVSGETCFARSTATSTCFGDATSISTTRWGWINGYSGPVTETLELWCGAGQCNIETKGKLTGYVHLVYDGTMATVTFDTTASGTIMTGTHVYVGSEQFPKKNEKFTVSPGQYPYVEDKPNPTTDTATFMVSGPIYLIAHADT